MIPWEIVDTAPIPGQGGEMQLSRRGDEFSISIVGAGVLMGSRAHGSEDELARLACRKIADRTRARVLIGGLGMGFTLAAALQYLNADVEVVVAELVPAVVRWNKGDLGAVAGNPLADPRTTVIEGDVAKIIRTERQGYDAILLDVDNGPAGMTRKKNNRLYSIDGLAATYTALRPLGLLAVWSAGPDRKFTQRLQKTGFKVSQARVRESGNRGKMHTIWLGERDL